jgi:phage terminase small subunit
MPVLKNPKWERLAQELAQNKTATEAMRLAGYSDPRNSTRLTKKEEIRRRIEELQSRGAKRAEVSVASLLQEPKDARAKASSLDQLSAAVRAIEAKARVSGLLVQKVEVTSGQEFDCADTLEDIAAATAHGLGYEITGEDRAELGRLMHAWYNEGHEQIRQFLASCNAKPVQQATNRRDMEAIERKRLGLPAGRSPKSGSVR